MTDSKKRWRGEGGGARRTLARLARLALKDGGGRTGEKETSRKRRRRGRGVGRWMEGGGTCRLVPGWTREEGGGDWGGRVFPEVTASEASAAAARWTQLECVSGDAAIGQSGEATFPTLRGEHPDTFQGGSCFLCGGGGGGRGSGFYQVVHYLKYTRSEATDVQPQLSRAAYCLEVKVFQGHGLKHQSQTNPGPHIT